ncbi:MAG: peroxiredoxin [Acidimicrobiia bacterium]
MSDANQLPPGLPEPVDDGACDHLVGLDLSDVGLEAVDGQPYSLRSSAARWLVIYVYPRTGGGDVVLPADWDLIPGARGCTPQACAFRDHQSDLEALDATVWGVSAQPIHEQREFAERMHIRFPLLNDSSLFLAKAPMQLPTFVADGLTLYKRVTFIATRASIVRVFYPVFPPDRNAVDVIAYLASHQ